MHLLPTNLARLAKHTDARSAVTRFALTGVRVVVGPDNTFLAEATDTKVLVRVSGLCPAAAEEFPDGVPGFDVAPNGHTVAIVPGDAWEKTFTQAKKLTAKVRGGHAALRSVAVKVGEKVTTFGATNTESHQCESATNLEGRFPPTDDILAAKKDGAPVVKFAVDPVLLADLMKTCTDIACEQGDQRVEFEIPKGYKPIHVKAQRGRDGIAVHAVIMPLADESTDKEQREDAKKKADPLPEGVTLAGPDVTALEKKLGLVTAERDSLREEADRLRGVAVESNANAAEYRRKLDDALRELRALKAAGGTATTTEPAPARPLTRAERLGLVKPTN